MEKKLTEELVRKYIKYFYDTIDSIYSKHNINKEDIENFAKEFNRFKEKVNQESQIHHSFKELLNSMQFEIKRNPRKSRLRNILEKIFFFINFNDILMSLVRDEISRKDTKIIVTEIRNQLSHLLFKLNSIRIFV